MRHSSLSGQTPFTAIRVLSPLSIAAVVLLLFLVTPVASMGAVVVNTDISITRGEAVKISNVEDWDFGSYSPLAVTSSSLRLRDRTCVFSTTGGYSLQVTSQNGGNRLRLANGAGNRMRYSIAVRYRQGNRFRNQRVRRSGEVLVGLTSSLALDCSDQGARNWNLQFRPIIGRNAFNNAQPGIYQDRITLLVTPE